MYTNQRGVSLVELIMFIVIVSTAMVGILSVIKVTNAHSADPLIHKQAVAIAESLLEEVELQDFVAASGAGATTAVTTTNRTTNYHIVTDYNNFSMTGITLLDGTSPTGLANYKSKVVVTNATIGTVASAVLITVTVSEPTGVTVQLDGYRTAY
jgi:MSHA pilin protein MshD